MQVSNTRTVLFQESQEDIWVGDAYNYIGAYPSWWPPRVTFISPKPEFLYGFPALSDFSLAGEMKYRNIQPALNKIQNPPLPLYKLLPEIETLGALWFEAGKKKDFNIYAFPAQEFYDRNQILIKTYFYTHFKRYLNFFGINYEGVKPICFEGAEFFQKGLNHYLPGKWILMVHMSLLIYIQVELKKGGPFQHWGKISYEDISNNVVKLTPSLRPLHYLDIFKLGAKRNAAKDFPTLLSIIEPLKKELELFIFYLNMTKDERRNKVHMHFFIMQSEKILPLFKDLISIPFIRGSLQKLDTYSVMTQPYSHLSDVNGFVVYSLLSMYEDYLFLKRKFEESSPSEEFKEEVTDRMEIIMEEEDYLQKIHISDPELMIYVKSLKDFKELWKTTAVYNFLGLGRPEWPPTPQQFQVLKRNTSQDALTAQVTQEIIDFIENHPPPRLAVPGGQIVSRLGIVNQEWEAVYTIQFQDYIKWAYFNMQAMKNPFYNDVTSVYGSFNLEIENKNGDVITLKDNDSDHKYPLVNIYPDYGIFATHESDSQQFIQQIARFAFFGVNIAEMVWGDKFWDGVFGEAQRFINRVFGVLKEIATLVVQVAKKVVKEGIKVAKEVGKSVADVLGIDISKKEFFLYAGGAVVALGAAKIAFDVVENKLIE